MLSRRDKHERIEAKLREGVNGVRKETTGKNENNYRYELRWRIIENFVDMCKWKLESFCRLINTLKIECGILKSDVNLSMCIENVFNNEVGLDLDIEKWKELKEKEHFGEKNGCWVWFDWMWMFLEWYVVKISKWGEQVELWVMGMVFVERNRGIYIVWWIENGQV